jgi:glycosyltransferase involved in cell wall biosynthesis
MLLAAERYLLRNQKFNRPPSGLMLFVERRIKRELGGKEEIKPGSVKEIGIRKKLKFLGIRGLVLKAPRNPGQKDCEKGVLLIKIGALLKYFYEIVDLDSLLRDYTLVLEDVWSIYAKPEILFLTKFSDHEIFMMTPDQRDYSFLNRMALNLVPIRIGSCSWANPSVFYPIRDQKKEFDAVMISGWQMYKRHHVMFRAVKKIRDPSLRVALIGRSFTGDRREIESLADFYGVKDNIEIIENLEQTAVNRVLNRSKVNVVLSLQEGGNRGLFEGFFSGTPGIALRKNIGICKEYFNQRTGRLVHERNLWRELMHFREKWADYDPAHWARNNISPEISTARINDSLKRAAENRSEAWTTDLVAKCNSPNMAYYPDDTVAKGLPKMTDILMRYAKTREIREMVRKSVGG